VPGSRSPDQWGHFWAESEVLVASIVVRARGTITGRRVVVVDVRAGCHVSPAVAEGEALEEERVAAERVDWAANI
jgi:hypothetical protein